jgi:hypothetical protein
LSGSSEWDEADWFGYLARNVELVSELPETKLIKKFKNLGGVKNIFY